MILFVFGTTAEAIKIAPLVIKLESLQSDFTLLSTGQQGNQAETTLRSLGVKSEVKYLIYRKKPISNFGQATRWFLTSSIEILLRSKSRLELSWKTNDFVIIHGDTLSTFLGLIFALRFRKSLAHIEAGLRSYRIFHPFPEEIVRRVVALFSDVNFAPSDDAVLNLQKMRGAIINTQGNTAIDAMSLFDQSNLKESKIPFCLVLLHRTELIHNSRLMKETLQELGLLSRSISVVMVQDYVTEERMRNLVKDFPGVEIVGKQDFYSFQMLLRTSSFVITDSGGLQEECAAIGKPCLIHRIATERSEGIGRNAVLSRWEKGRISNFYSVFHSLEKPVSNQVAQPTSIILESLRQMKAL
jgi:UDP-N-acetylglucosamine 2-epimerase (non-hydrolysing)